jgi:predicted NBD/HSP70 family sugar kinase
VARRIALGVAAVCTVLDPGLVVLTGQTGLAGGDRLAEMVREHVERVAPVHPRVVPSGVGESAVLDGATLRAVRSARQMLLARLDDGGPDV